VCLRERERERDVGSEGERGREKEGCSEANIERKGE